MLVYQRVPIHFRPLIGVSFTPFISEVSMILPTWAPGKMGPQTSQISPPQRKKFLHKLLLKRRTFHGYVGETLESGNHV